MIKIKLQKQSTGYSCGPASLKMALSHFGIDESEENLIKLTGAKEGYGCHPKDIVRASKALGIKARYIETSSIDEIRQYLNYHHSLIVDWFSPTANGHYSMVVDLDGEYITLADPEIGDLRKLEIKDFLNHWFELDNYPPQDTKNFYLRELIIIDKNH